MREFDSVSKTAKLFRVTPSALRYWDDEGLIRFERGENNYRHLTFQALMDICEVLLYRNMRIPIKKIKELPTMTYSQLQKLFFEKEKQLNGEIKELKRTIKKIKYNQNMLKMAKKLEEFSLERCTFHKNGAFDYNDKKAMEIAVENSFQTNITIDLHSDTFEYGIFSKKSEFITNKKSKLYLKGLLKINACDVLQNNKGDFYKKATELDYIPKKLVGRYLITACENGTRYDYYQGWLELE